MTCHFNERGSGGHRRYSVETIELQHEWAPSPESLEVQCLTTTLPFCSGFVWWFQLLLHSGLGEKMGTKAKIKVTEERPGWHRHPNGGGWVQDTASVAKTVFVGEGAWVYGNAWVYGDAVVCGDAVVYGDAEVYGGLWLQSPLYIQGSRYALTVCAPGEIAIGCERHAIAKWLKQGEELGRAHGFTDAEIAEYRAYVELAAKLEKVKP